MTNNFVNPFAASGGGIVQSNMTQPKAPKGDVQTPYGTPTQVGQLPGGTQQPVAPATPYMNTTGTGTPAWAQTPQTGGTAQYGDNGNGIQTIQDLYTVNLNRQGDAEGMKYWTDRFMGDGVISPEERQQFALVAMPEYMANRSKGPQMTPATPSVPQPSTDAMERASVTNWNVDPNQTVRNHVKELVDEDGVLMQQARARGLMQANERGLVNSSMGIGAAQQAVMDQAVNIGARDAQTYAQAGQFNADSSNKNSMFNASQFNGLLENQRDRTWRTGERVSSQDFTAGQNAVDRDWRTGERLDSQDFTSDENYADREWKSYDSEAGRNWQSGENSTNRDWQSGESAAERAFRAQENQKARETTVSQSNLDTATKKELMEIENRYRMQMNADSALSDHYRMYTEAIFKIDGNPDMDAAAKTAMKQMQRDAFTGFAKMRGLNIDLNF